jgi:hypothetical protein
VPASDRLCRSASAPSRPWPIHCSSVTYVRLMAPIGFMVASLISDAACIALILLFSRSRRISMRACSSGKQGTHVEQQKEMPKQQPHGFRLQPQQRQSFMHISQLRARRNGRTCQETNAHGAFAADAVTQGTARVEPSQRGPRGTRGKTHGTQKQHLQHPNLQFGST